MKTNFNIVLVHGAFGDGSHWRYIIPALSNAGYTVRAMQLSLASLSEDIQKTSDLVSALNGPTLLVGHSYAGMVISAVGNLPTVKGMVYVAAFAPEKGESVGVLSHIGETPEGSTAVATGPSGLLFLDYERFHELYCPEVSENEAMVLASAQKPISQAIIDGEFDFEPAWKDKPSWYQTSVKDKMIIPATQALFIERIRPIKTVTLEAGHATIISHHELISSLILEAADSLLQDSELMQ
ncbi:alpha/beta hydrolase [Mucilaginibacter sp. cycad4]|uniref:alpha/beta fold hydrolase n=1 Tax=Mucilaginibacter sp. cycad4 TaxID=3342096 RepID=UPI002AAC1CC1|nr:alpha/beta hydrolase [Mucilaginibacter gossypii]WPU99155.1 alpha/beta hydrolase [Mucilaginibacter gossypii]